MTIGRLVSRASLVVGLAVFVGAAAASDGNPCIDDAKENFADCKAPGNEGFHVANDDSLSRDRGCMEGGRAAREACALATSLTDDLAACRATLQGAKQTCRTLHAGDPVALDSCI